MDQRVQDFVNQWNGKHDNYDNSLGTQCKDTFSRYNRDVAKNPSYVYGDAWQLWEKAPTEYYEKIVNTNTSIPNPGDVIVWKKEFGGYGHVAIALDGCTVNKLRVFGQNYPNTTKLDKNNNVISLGSPCQVVEMSYSKVQGYLRPKSLYTTPAPQPVEPTPPAPAPETVLKSEYDSLEAKYKLQGKTLEELQEKKVKDDDIMRTQAIKIDEHEKDKEDAIAEALLKAKEEWKSDRDAKIKEVNDFWKSEVEKINEQKISVALNQYRAVALVAEIIRRSLNLLNKLKGVKWITFNK